jgi:DNA-binding GntR family transcriptional regulator
MLKAMRAHDGEAASQALAMDIQSAAEVILSGTGLKDQ